VLVSEQEQQMLDQQRTAISKNDRKRSKAERSRREGYSEVQKAIIDTNYRQFKGVAAGEKDRHPSSGELPLERIKKIERMKRDILRFQRFYDKSSEEVASLLSSLEDYYAELEGDIYTANSFVGELTVRGGDYNKAADGWNVTVYSELFGLCSLFRYSGKIDYKEMIKKGGKLLGSNGFSGLDKDSCILVADSLFARAVPMLFATLKYRIVRGLGASQYRLVPVSLTLARTDNLKEVLSIGRDQLAQASFYMTPQFAVGTPLDMGAANEAPAQPDKKAKEKEPAQAYEKEPEPEKRGGTFTELALAKQKKRRVLFITADTAIHSLANYDIKDLELNAIKLNFEFAHNDYIFYGGGLSWRYMGRNSESFYGAFVNGGAGITLFRNFRPYLLLEAFANTGAELGLGTGCGLDFTIKHLLLNLNWAFNWSYDADLKHGNKNSTFATVGMGFGFTW
jgi:hypothetical protein